MWVTAASERALDMEGLTARVVQWEHPATAGRRRRCGGVLFRHLRKPLPPPASTATSGLLVSPSSDQSTDRETYASHSSKAIN